MASPCVGPLWETARHIRHIANAMTWFTLRYILLERMPQYSIRKSGCWQQCISKDISRLSSQSSPVSRNSIPYILEAGIGRNPANALVYTHIHASQIFPRTLHRVFIPYCFFLNVIFRSPTRYKIMLNSCSALPSGVTKTTLCRHIFTHVEIEKLCKSQGTRWNERRWLSAKHDYFIRETKGAERNNVW